MSFLRPAAILFRPILPYFPPEVFTRNAAYECQGVSRRILVAVCLYHRTEMTVVVAIDICKVGNSRAAVFIGWTDR